MLFLIILKTLLFKVISNETCTAIETALMHPVADDLLLRSVVLPEAGCALQDLHITEQLLVELCVYSQG